MSKFQAPKGVSEYFPPNSNQFEYVRDQLLRTARLAGYNLIELPVFEDTEVFTRGVGESTDVVSKEMYTFEDRGGRSITLRPEGTAGVMRAVIEHNLDKGQLPVKLFYTGPFFRAERPQAGRYRQFYQVGIEAIGYSDPEIDVEVISVADSAARLFLKTRISSSHMKPVTNNMTIMNNANIMVLYPNLLFYWILFIFNAQNCQKRFLWNFNTAHLFHAFLALFLFFQQLAFTRNIAPVTFCQHILTHRFHGFACNNIGTN